MSDMRIINTYDQCVAAGGDRIVLYYFGRPDSRSCSGPHWSVGRIKDGKSLETIKNSAWYDHGHKTFYFGYPIREHKETALQEAISWANEKYGPREFVRNRMGDYVEREVNEKFPIPRRINEA
jgi:hypothetical protein